MAKTPVEHVASGPAPDGIDLPSGPHPEDRVAWLRYAVLCDQARTENTGKRLLIGCYDTTVVFHTRPALLSARLVGAFEFVRPGAHTVMFRVSTPSAVGSGEMASTEDAPAGAVAPFDVEVSGFIYEPSQVRLDWRVDGRDWGPPMIWQLSFAENARILPKAQADLIGRTWNLRAEAMGGADDRQQEQPNQT